MDDHKLSASFDDQNGIKRLGEVKEEDKEEEDGDEDKSREDEVEIN